MRKIAVISGILVCALGVGFTIFWLIAAGFLLMIASSFLPDSQLLHDQNELPILLPVSTWMGIAGIGLSLVTVMGVWNNIEARWPLGSWSAGLLLILLATIFHDSQHGFFAGWRLALRKFVRTPDFLLLLLLMLAGFVLRYRQLDSLPPMHGDEGEMGILALKVFALEQLLPPFSTGFLDHPTLFHFLQAISMGIFGQTVSGLRMVSVIFGTMCIPAVYAVGRLGWGKTIGLVAATILAFSHVHIHFSRMGLNNIHSVFFATLLILLVFWADRSVSDAFQADKTALTPWLSIGLVIGLAQYFYFGSRLLPILLIPILMMIWWRHLKRLNYRAEFQLSALIPVGFLAAWLPLVPRFIQVPSTFLSRQTGVNIFLDQNLPGLVGESASTWEILLFQIERNLRFFIDSGDVSSFYFGGAPGLSMLTAILFWVGLGLALSKLRTFSNAVILCWFGLGLLLGGILTNTAPAATRLVIIYPAVALLGGFAVESLLSLLPLPQKSAVWTEYGLIVVLACILAPVGYQIYFRDYAQAPPYAHMVAVGRELELHTDSADRFLLGAPILFIEHGTIRFLNKPSITLNNLESIDKLPSFRNEKPHLFVVGLPPYEEEMAQLQAEFPGGEFKQVDGVNGRVLYYSYLVEH